MATTPEIINDLRAQAVFYHQRHDANLTRSLKRAADRLEELAAENQQLRDEIDTSNEDFAPIQTKRQKPLTRG